MSDVIKEAENMLPNSFGDHLIVYPEPEWKQLVAKLLAHAKELEELVKIRGDQLLDWKFRYGQIEAERDALRSEKRKGKK